MDRPISATCAPGTMVVPVILALFQLLCARNSVVVTGLLTVSTVITVTSAPEQAQNSTSCSYRS